MNESSKVLYYLGIWVSVPYSPQDYSNNPFSSPTEGGKKSLFFLSKPKSNDCRKNLFQWGMHPCEIPSCEMGAHLAWSQWFRWKILLQGETEITKTPLRYTTVLFPFCSHLLIILCLILSTTCQYFYSWLHLAFFNCTYWLYIYLFPCHNSFC